MKIHLATLLTIIFLTSGCSTVGHMDELLRLKGYSKEKDRQENIVQRQNKNFENLTAAVSSKGLKHFPDKKSILKGFGKPVFTYDVVKEGKNQDVWLYRYSTKFFGSDKIYLYFDQQGKLKDYDMTVGQSIKTTASQTAPSIQREIN